MSARLAVAQALAEADGVTWDTLATAYRASYLDSADAAIDAYRQATPE